MRRMIWKHWCDGFYDRISCNTNENNTNNIDNDKNDGCNSDNTKSKNDIWNIIENNNNKNMIIILILNDIV